jgi:hypothetical protein
MMLPCWKKKKNHLMWLAVAAFTLRLHCSSSAAIFSSIEANVFLRQFLFLEHTTTIIIPHQGKSSPSSLNRSKIEEDIVTKISRKRSSSSSKSRRLAEKERINKRSKSSSKRRIKKETVSHHGYYQVLLDSVITVGSQTVPGLSVARDETPLLSARVLKLAMKGSTTTRRQEVARSTIQGSI